jgi:hypothetical protein
MYSNAAVTAVSSWLESTTKHAALLRFLLIRLLRYKFLARTGRPQTKSCCCALFNVSYTEGYMNSVHVTESLTIKQHAKELQKVPMLLQSHGQFPKQLNKITLANAAQKSSNSARL